jgi:chromosome segregation protein
VHLKSLTLKGFKSFPDRTRLDFGPGVSVVVGPNGSGKSNITDAILWAMGEQSPLAIRGQSMQDVIFGGGRGVQARSSASVELVLDNSDGTIALPLSEISILRRLERSGEGEYRLNGARCRLADVIEVLSDTGLGKETHSVISQGRVESIVTSKPRDRRLLIEEAAGLGKHRKRRRRAQLKLERTQENLDRALDVEREARSRLRPLKRQAEAAELHERLQHQLLEARLTLATDALRAAHAELQGAEGAVAAARTARASVESDLAAIVERRGAAERALAERSAHHDALAARVFRARAAHERLQLRHEHTAAAAASLNERRARVQHELSQLADLLATAPSAEAELGGSRVRELEQQLAELDGERELELERELAELAGGEQQAQADVARCEQALQDARDERLQAQDAANDARAALREAERAVHDARREAARVGADLAAVNQFLQGHRRSLLSARGSASDSRAVGGPAHTGADDHAPRALSELLDVPSGLELAIAAILGPRLDAALVADLAAAGALLDRAGPDGGAALVAGREALGGLAAAGNSDQRADATAGSAGGAPLGGASLGGASLGEASVGGAPAGGASLGGASLGETSAGGASADGAPVGRASAGEPPAPGARALLELVSGPPAVLSLAARLLADTWLVDDLAVLPADFAGVAVTPAGRVWRAATGEVRQLAAGGSERVLARRNEREHLLAATEAAAAAEQAAHAGVERAQAALGAVAEKRERAEEALRDSERAHARALEGARHAAWLVEQRRAAPEQGALAVRRAQLQGELAAERRQLERHQREHAERQRRADQLRARDSADGELLPQATRLAAALEGAATAVAARVADLDAELQRHSAAGEEMAGELRECAAAEADLQTRLRTVGEQVTAAEVAAQRLRDQAADAATELREVCERLQLPEPDPAEQAPLQDDERQTLDARVERLRRRREQLGPVNPLAQEEYAQALAHVEELEARRTDLETALRELRTLIRDTDRQIHETFRATFEAAARNFEELARDVFPGGAGRLRLVKEEHAPRPVLGGQPVPAGAPRAGAGADGDPAEGVDAEAAAQAAEHAAEQEAEVSERGEDQEELLGVEIEITPAGKSAKRLTLLSGGEKSMTALAFLFAVFLARPCPFYILDEVEAALDDLNLDRFLTLLRRYANRAQFIVITHQKRTMDAADWLYGVSMAGNGVSKVISRRLPPAEGDGDRGEDTAPDGAELDGPGEARDRGQPGGAVGMRDSGEAARGGADAGGAVGMRDSGEAARGGADAGGAVGVGDGGEAARGGADARGAVEVGHGGELGGPVEQDDSGESPRAAHASEPVAMAEVA